jgi:prepilin-type N-terminal cleavage/methylation domain-containing protein
MANGFTLFELMVVIAIVLMIALVGYPALQQRLEQARVKGFIESASARIGEARAEAIRGRFPVVVQPDVANNVIVMFANVDNDANYAFNPDPTQTHRTADYEISRVRLPVDFDVEFRTPVDKGPGKRDIVDGLTDTSADDNAAVFLPDGSAQDSGGFRFGDTRGNYFEVRVFPKATGKIQIQKWDPEPPWGGSADFFPRGRHPTADVPMWRWF